MKHSGKQIQIVLKMMLESVMWKQISDESVPSQETKIKSYSKVCYKQSDLYSASSSSASSSSSPLQHRGDCVLHHSWNGRVWTKTTKAYMLLVCILMLWLLPEAAVKAATDKQSNKYSTQDILVLLQWEEKVPADWIANKSNVTAHSLSLLCRINFVFSE